MSKLLNCINYIIVDKGVQNIPTKEDTNYHFFHHFFERGLLN